MSVEIQLGMHVFAKGTCIYFLYIQYILCTVLHWLYTATVTSFVKERFPVTSQRYHMIIIKDNYGLKNGG